MTLIHVTDVYGQQPRNSVLEYAVTTKEESGNGAHIVSTHRFRTEEHAEEFHARCLERMEQS